MGGGPLLLRAWMQEIAKLKRDHAIEVAWVTSGAIASAMERTKLSKTERTLPEKQALSAIGQPLLMDLYNLSLQAVGLIGAQILLTYEDMSDKVRRTNLQSTLETLLAWDIVPILNENDAVATEEIKFGDNDSLSAKVACMLNADRLVILTDVDGLYEKDPRKHKNAKLVASVPRVTDAILSKLDQGAGSHRGTGGMYSKMRAAKEATDFGIPTFLVKGNLPNILIELAQGKATGTSVGKKK